MTHLLNLRDALYFMTGFVDFIFFLYILDRFRHFFFRGGIK